MTTTASPVAPISNDAAPESDSAVPRLPILKVLRVDPARTPIRVQEGFNLRKDMGDLESLKRSIVANGLQHPLHCSVLKGAGSTVYTIEDGHRRYAAIQLAMKEGVVFDGIPVLVVDERDESVRILDQFCRNSGMPFSALEHADGVKRLFALGLSEDDVKKALGFSDTYYASLRLLFAAPKEARKLVESSKLSSSMLIDVMRAGHTGKELVSILKRAEEKADKNGTRIMPKHLDVSVPKRNATRPAKVAKDPVAEAVRRARGRKLSDAAKARLEGVAIAQQIIAGKLTVEAAVEALTANAK